jgi:hypothetical protein
MTPGGVAALAYTPDMSCGRYLSSRQSRTPHIVTVTCQVIDKRARISDDWIPDGGLKDPVPLVRNSSGSLNALISEPAAEDVCHLIYTYLCADAARRLPRESVPTSLSID